MNSEFLTLTILSVNWKPKYFLNMFIGHTFSQKYKYFSIQGTLLYTILIPPNIKFSTASFILVDVKLP